MENCIDVPFIANDKLESNSRQSCELCGFIL